MKRKKSKTYKIRYYDDPKYLKEHGGNKYPYVAIGNKAWGVFHTYKKKKDAHKKLLWIHQTWGRANSANMRVVKTGDSYSLVQLSKNPAYQSKLDAHTKKFLK